MFRSPEGSRLAWKMSIDLTRPLVPSSGLHDPLDGLLTMSALVATRPESVPGTLLAPELTELKALCRGASWVTRDVLGAGGLLVDVLRCAQLVELDHPTGIACLPSVAEDARASLAAMSGFSFLGDPPGLRLAFRELGLVIGLRAVARVDDGALGSDPPPVPGSTWAALRGYEAVGERILGLWSRRPSRRARTWMQHRDISDVMWATCLAPEGYLVL